MNAYTPGLWKYFKNTDGNFSVFPAEGYNEGQGSVNTLIAEVFTENIPYPETNAKLIAASPEMWVALLNTVEALRATEVFMCGLGLNTCELTQIIKTIDELLDKLDVERQEA